MKQAHLPNYTHSWCFPQCCPRGVSHHIWQVVSPWCWVLSVSQRQPKLGTRALVPGLYNRDSTALSGPLKKGGFSFSLSFCLFLNVPRLAQQLGSPWLQGHCCQQCPAASETQAASALPQGWAIWEDVTSGKGHQIRRCFSVWGDEIFNPCSLWDMHHGRFTYLLLGDSSGWQGRWQLTHINPAERHKLSLQSRNPSLLFKHQGSVSVPDTKHRQHLHWKVNTAGCLGAKGARTSAPAAPAGPAAVALVPEQSSTKWHTRTPEAPLLTWLMDQNERKIWTNITSLGCGWEEAFIGAFLSYTAG